MVRKTLTYLSNVGLLTIFLALVALPLVPHFRLVSQEDPAAVLSAQTGQFAGRVTVQEVGGRRLRQERVELTAYPNQYSYYPNLLTVENVTSQPVSYQVRVLAVNDQTNGQVLPEVLVWAHFANNTEMTNLRPGQVGIVGLVVNTPEDWSTPQRVVVDLLISPL